ncbi:MAG: AMP-binding protein, partial [Hyphomicrobiales bacterium]
MPSRYHEVYDAWKKDPEGFWAEAAKAIDWIRPAAKVFDPDMAVYGQWFAGAECNTCHNCLDRHVKTRGDQAALIYDSPITGKMKTYSYRQLTDEVSAFGAVLRELGIAKGDRVIIYMPMIPETAIAMLACARIGAIHSVVFGGFAAHELATRIDDATPKAILAASCGIEPGRVVEYKPLLDAAIEEAKFKPEACVVLQREQAEASMIEGRDHDWSKLMEAARKAGKTSDCVPV